MTRLSLITFIATLTVGAVLMLGCRTHHLGNSHGRAFHNAFDKQADTAGRAALTPMTADEAKQVMHVHNGEPKAAGKSGSGTSTNIAMPTTSSSSNGNMGGGKWPGASGSINLEAK